MRQPCRLTFGIVAALLLCVAARAEEGAVELEVRLFLDGRSSSTTLRAQGGESAEAAVQRFMREQGLHTRKDAGDLSVKLLNAVRSRMAERREPEPALQQRAGEVQVASTAAAAAEVASAASIPALASEVAESDATVWMPISAPLVVRRGQTLASAARAFCEEHGLDPSATAPALLASLRDTQRHLAGAPARAVLGATPLVQAAAPRFPGSAGRHWPPLPVIASRGEFGTLLEQLGFRTGIEIGVQRGWFAAHLLQTWPSCTAYYGIDPWERQVLYTDAANVEQEEHDSNYAATLATLARFGSKVHLLRNYSVDAVSHFADESIDFVYVDARHDYFSVYEDLTLYWPKLRPGGILAGHDFLTAPEVRQRTPGQDWGLGPQGQRNEGAVKGAVVQFAKEQGRQLIVAYNDQAWPSWYMRK